MAPDPAESDTTPIDVPLVWVGVDELPVHASNQLVAQIAAREEIILSFGHVSPPVILGDPEMRRTQLSQMPYVPITPLARFSLTREKLQEFVDVLAAHVRSYDETFPAKED